MSKYNFAKRLKHHERSPKSINGVELIVLPSKYEQFAGGEARRQYFCEGTDTPRHVCRRCTYSIIYFRPDTATWHCEMCEYTGFQTSGSTRKVLAVFMPSIL